MRTTQLVVGLEDGGNVVSVIVVETAAPFVRFIGEGGLKEQVAPAIRVTSHTRVTLLATLL